MMILRQRMLLAMHARGICQAELARQLGCHRSQINQWISGFRTPNIENLVAIAKVLNVSTDWLLGLAKKRRRWFVSLKN